MKRTILILVLATIAFMAFGQAPSGFNYQALIYENDAPVSEK